jgi:hypothetical protein
VERAPSTHWIGGWVGPRAGLEDMETLSGLELRPLGRPAYRQWLYRLNYRGSSEDSLFEQVRRCCMFSRRVPWMHLVGLFVIRIMLRSGVYCSPGLKMKTSASEDEFNCVEWNPWESDGPSHYQETMKVENVLPSRLGPSDAVV